MDKLFRIILGVLMVISLSNCDSSQSKPSTKKVDETLSGSKSNKGQAFIKDDGSRKNILQIAISSKDHTTLVAAVQAAQLENALVNAGPLTVFAPVNSAFDALPEGVVANLLKPENKAQLSDILLYHVTPGSMSINILKRMKKLGQANNKYVAVTLDKDGNPLVGGAKILATIKAGNGIIHVVDKVLLPPATPEKK